MSCQHCLDMITQNQTAEVCGIMPFACPDVTSMSTFPRLVCWNAATTLTCKGCHAVMRMFHCLLGVHFTFTQRLTQVAATMRSQHMTWIAGLQHMAWFA